MNRRPRSVRFDDSPPGDVSPESPSGWVSEDELPLRQTIEKADAGGPSGVGGYAIAVSPDGLLAPCAGPICLAEEMAVTSGADGRIAVIDRLVEGSHWVSAVAASGAMLSSRQPGSTVVRVDRTDPATSISGLPAGWVNRPVTLTVRATDLLSGMEADPGRDDGRPVTVIAAEGQAPYESSGPVATFTVASEGATPVGYWARDLAGNVNDGSLAPDGKRHRPPGRATVRIDSTPPSLGFDSDRDPANPENVSVRVEDNLSGLDHGRIEIRRIGSRAGFSALGTTTEGGRLLARIPSDDLPAGTYELRAEATDRAGNSGSTVMTTGGSAMVLKLPLKKSVGLSLRHQGKKAGSRRVLTRHGRVATVSGRIRHLRGPGIPAARLVLEERFGDGSRRKLRRRSVTVDGTGRFALEAEAGPEPPDQGPLRRYCDRQPRRKPVDPFRLERPRQPAAEPDRAQKWRPDRDAGQSGGSWCDSACGRQAGRYPVLRPRPLSLAAGGGLAGEPERSLPLRLPLPHDRLRTAHSVPGGLPA